MGNSDRVCQVALLASVEPAACAAAFFHQPSAPPSCSSLLDPRSLLATPSLDVLAYVLGDILDPNASVFDATWYISSGEGACVPRRRPAWPESCVGSALWRPRRCALAPCFFSSHYNLSPCFAGDYTADSNVIVTGNAVPKRRSTLFDEAVSIPEPSQVRPWPSSCLRLTCLCNPGTRATLHDTPSAL